MPIRPTLFSPHPQRSSVDADRERGTSRERGYTAEWDKASKAHRHANPLCRYCELAVFDAPRIRLCVATDHLYPHRKFAGVFWEAVWWVSACTDCHNAKRVIERRGKSALDRLARRLGLPTLRQGVGV